MTTEMGTQENIRHPGGAAVPAPRPKLEKLTLKVTGMTCAACSAAVTRSLLRQPGVKMATVNLATETALVEYDPSGASVDTLRKAVKDAGYGVVTDSVTLKIGQMNCAACVRTVENALKKLDGVSGVVVNLGTEKAFVTYDSARVGVNEMKKAISGAGYQFLGREGDDTTKAEKEAREIDLGGKLRRAAVGFAVGLFLMFLMLADSWVMNATGLDMMTISYIMLLTSLPAFVYTSHPIFNAAYRALKNYNLSMDVMYAMGIGVAYGASVLGTLVESYSDFVFYDSALLLAAFLMIGRYLEASAKGRTSDAIKKLMNLRPKTATIIVDGKEVSRNVDELSVGDIVLVRPGERVSVDGEVVQGSSFVDESMITGESVAVEKKPGSEVIGGTLNRNGVLRFRARKVGSETVLAQIVRLVQDAQGSRPQIQKLADRAVIYFIPVVLAIAISVFAAWYFTGATMAFSLGALISVLVIACPCALGLATPTAVTVGVGRGAELGILIKNSGVLEASGKLSAVIFDKTGTLTRGHPEVTDIVAVGVSEDELLTKAAGLEANSQHPLAEAVVRKASTKKLAVPEITGFDTYGGMGVGGNLNGKLLLAGNRALMKEHGVDSSAHEDAILTMEKDAKTVILVAVQGSLIGYIAIADELKPTSKKAVTALRKMGLKVVMLTGDNSRTADAVARRVGIDDVRSEVLPGDKAAKVRELQSGGAGVAFVGDGINDAPALAQADVGIALGSGTDIARESGEVVLIKDDPMDAVAAILLSRKVMGRIRQNIFWAFAYNGALIPLAAGVLHPFFGIMLPPEIAGLAMAMSSVTVVSLSLMLRSYDPATDVQ